MYASKRGYRRKTGAKRPYKSSKVAKTVFKRRGGYKKRYGRPKSRLGFEIHRVKMTNLVNSFTRFTTPKHFKYIQNERKYATAAKNLYVQAYASGFTSSAGLQNYTDVNFQNVSELRTALTNVLGITLPNTAGSENNTSKIFWMNNYEEMYLTNSSNAPMYLDLYVWKCIQNTNSSPTQLWANSINDAVGAVVPTISTVGVSMTDGMFGIGVYWKLLRIEKMILNPGQNHTHILNIHNNRIMNLEELDYNQTNSYLGNYSYSCSLVFRGSNDSVSGSCGIAPTNLLMSTTTRVGFKYINDQRYTAVFVNGIGTSAGNIYNQGSGNTVTATTI